MRYVAIDLVNGKNVIGILDDEELQGSTNVKIIMPMQLKSHTVRLGPTSSSESVSGSPYLLFSDDVYTLIPKSKIVSISNLSEFSKKLYMFLIDRHQTMDEMIRAGVHTFVESDLVEFRTEKRMIDDEEEPSDEDLHEEELSPEDTSKERVLH